MSSEDERALGRLSRVLTCFVVIAIVCNGAISLGKAADSPVIGEGTALVERSLAQSATSGDPSESADSVLSAYQGSLPAEFVAEVSECVGAEEVWVDGNVVGVMEGFAPEESFERWSGCLVDGGWKQVESGRSTLGSFVKDEGSITWLFLSCEGSGSQTVSTFVFG